MKRIIFINRFFYPDESATSQILSDLLFKLSLESNSEFHVITSRNTYQNDRRLESEEIINNVHVHRIWTSRFGRKYLVGRAADYLSFYLLCFYKLLVLARENDVVVSKTDPPVISSIAYLVAKLKNAYLVNWLQDLFPEVAQRLGMIKEKNQLYRVVKKIKDKTVLSADCNVVIGNRMADKLRAIGVDSSRIVTISNWNINEDISRIDKSDNDLISEWGLKNKFIVGYSGNFGRAHEYNIVQELVSHYNHNKELFFLFIGGGKYYDDLKKYVIDNAIDNVVFKPYQPSSILNKSLSIPDLHLISLRPGLEGLIVPSKFFGLASIGSCLLFIGDCEGELGQIIRQNNCGFCSSSSLDSVTSIIDEAVQGKLDIDCVKENLKKVYMEQYTPKNAYTKWQSVLERFER